MNLDYDILNKISRDHGDSFYLLDSSLFVQNFNELKEAFCRIYPKTVIAYSYKTNYIPKLCRLIEDKGGYAEVVSDMEYDLARGIGVNSAHIVFNGPNKRRKVMEEILLSGGIVNLDSNSEIQPLCDIVGGHPDTAIKIGIRCNFMIGKRTSRFGFDIESDMFVNLIRQLKKSNIPIKCFHCHLKGRDLESWANKTDRMIEFIDALLRSGTILEPPEFINLGGGLLGKQKHKTSIDTAVIAPSFQNYAEVIATKFRDRFGEENGPTLILEPGTALAADVMKYIVKVIDIKLIRGKLIATVAGSIFNYNSFHRDMFPSITVCQAKSSPKSFNIIDIAGHTCMEDDYLFKGFEGNLNVGDYIVCENAGAYSLVLKPPFIFPNCAIVEYNNKTDSFETIKRRERYEDIFACYCWKQEP